MAANPAAPPLAYGDSWVEDYLPPAVILEGRLLLPTPPNAVPEIADVDAALIQALEHSSTPRLSPSLLEWLTGYSGGDVAVIVDDHTRPCAHQRRLLPGLLRWLEGHEVNRERIALVIAAATHREPRPEEYPKVFGGEVWPEWSSNIFPHDDQQDLVTLDTMPDGTLVEINGRVARSELVLSLSDLDYHYFAGVSGGPKHLVPGIAGRALTTADHLRMFGDLGFAPGVEMGHLDGNPVYEFKREAFTRIERALADRRTFLYGIIAVLNPRQQFVALRGGEVLALHRQMRGILDSVGSMRLPRRADVVIVSAKHLGINLYQAGKAVHAATRAVRSGGTVLCLAPCPDGLGNEEFQRFMAVAAPFLRAGERSIQEGGAGDAFIDRALQAVQSAVMKDFKIGRQKPVDLLRCYRQTGWGNLLLLEDGLTEEDREMLPFRYIRGPGDAATRLRAWVDDRELRGKPTYAILDDPTYLVNVP